MLTGESEPALKQYEYLNLNNNTRIHDKHNIIFSSTTIIHGEADGIVILTGMKTEVGIIQQEIQQAKAEEEMTPLKKKLDEFGDRLSNVIIVICILVWVINYKNFWDEIHGSPILGCL